MHRAAAPAFAVMAVRVHFDDAPGAMHAGGHAGRSGGMASMRLLMSVFHGAPGSGARVRDGRTTVAAPAHRCPRAPA